MQGLSNLPQGFRGADAAPRGCAGAGERTVLGGGFAVSARVCCSTAVVMVADGAGSSAAGFALVGAGRASDSVGTDAVDALAADSRPCADGLWLTEILRTIPTAMSAPAATPAIQNTEGHLPAAVDRTGTRTPRGSVPEEDVAADRVGSRCVAVLSNAASTASICAGGGGTSTATAVSEVIEGRAASGAGEGARTKADVDVAAGSSSSSAMRSAAIGGSAAETDAAVDAVLADASVAASSA